MKGLALLVVAGLLATVIGYVGATKYASFFGLSPELAALSGNLSADQLSALSVAKADLKRKNIALVGAIFGAGLCGLGGIAAAAAAGAPGRAVIGALAGFCLGAVTGGLGGLLNVVLFERLRESDTSTFVSTVAAHGCMWALIAIGFTITVVVASRRNVAVQIGVATVLCGVIAAAVFPMVAAIAMPSSNPELPLPDTASAFWLWFGLPALLFAFGTARILSHAPHAAAPQPAVAAT